MPDQAPAPAQDSPPLLSVLEDLGTTLVASEIPAGSRVQHVLGAVVKVLEHAGVQVADELYPAEPEPVARPETAQAQHQAKTETRLDRIESALERALAALEGKDTNAPTPSVEHPQGETGNEAGS